MFLATLFRLPVILAKFQGCLGKTVTQRTEVNGAIRAINLVKLVTIIATVTMSCNLQQAEGQDVLYKSIFLSLVACGCEMGSRTLEDKY